MSRMTIRSTSNARAAISFDDAITGERVTLDCVVSEGGGARYVRVIERDGGTHQICERLSGSGNTLMCDPSRVALADVLRREYRAMRRAEAAALR